MSQNQNQNSKQRPIRTKQNITWHYCERKVKTGKVTGTRVNVESVVAFCFSLASDRLQQQNFFLDQDQREK